VRPMMWTMCLLQCSAIWG